METSIFEERIASDTATQRGDLFMVGIKVFLESWLIGMGDKKDNEVYYKLMYEAGGKEWAMGIGGGVHNLIIQEMAYKGFFTALAMVLYFYYLFKYCHIMSKKKQNYLYLLAFYYSLAFFIFMQTASAFFDTYSGIIVLVMTAMITSVYNNDYDISEFSFHTDEETSPLKINNGEIN
jgi:hypothetical protein